MRPVSGSEEDQTLIHLALESDPVGDASFPRPQPAQKAGHDAALLLRDALLLSLRRGAGPFRSFGQIAIEPRAYQLVPLLMALKLDPVRLLIADDVGIGKTIEAALIAREMIDRGDVQRLAVLCPPHLVEQWVTELYTRFHLRPIAVTAASASRLERNLPPSESIFTTHAHTVVSLDYIKSERRRAEFLRACPELVIVDEAHTCAATGQGRHQRYELLKGLVESKSRHLVMLTATPHSGDEQAFFRLLGLLDPAFTQLAEASGDARTELRERLSRHFVQRRRPDIDEWREGKLFPRRETKELTYKLTGAWERFFDAVLDYCAGVVAAAGADATQQRLSFWGTLALMRCVASSPLAALLALRTHAGVDTSDEQREELLDRIFDGSSEGLADDDLEPSTRGDDAAMSSLIAEAEDLAGTTDDPKLKLLTDHVKELVDEDFNPVVFCRYIATAHYVAKFLKGKLKDVTIDVVTGELTSDEREAKVTELGKATKRLLVATDCLSEGVNLQDHFDAVVHYDLSWNPTRHEQREGRVDRFGQKSEVVRMILLYGANNPVDGAVLDVILRKAEKIREELGVPVPIPDDGHSLSQALMKAVLLRQNERESKRQKAFSFVELEEAKTIEARWRDAAEKAKKNRTVFAQRRLKPEDVLPEWRKSLATLGGKEDVRRFAGRALARLGGALEPLKRGFRVPLSALPEDLRERLDAEGLAGSVLVDFDYPPAARCQPVQRSHPLISVVAETLLERTLGDADQNGGTDACVLGRVGCWVADGVTSRTIVALVRLRHQLTTQRGALSSMLLVEEASALAWSGPGAPAEGDEALKLLQPTPLADPPTHVRDRAVMQALAELETRLAELDTFAVRRAQALLADHRRVREAADARGSYGVRAQLPADIIGLYVLLPRVS